MLEYGELVLMSNEYIFPKFEMFHEMFHQKHCMMKRTPSVCRPPRKSIILLVRWKGLSLRVVQLTRVGG